ncbi:4'-phosphopantetheinyl transferase family protein [Streptomyces sp. S1]|uniref:4'-phosphopantetheinyl transferase family protein n=1 Tax=Streptomyces sp. S1 TaxID=718288 RepID=UPI003D730F7C
MIERLLPPGVASAEAYGDPPEALLFPTEEALVRRASEGRRREFTTVRLCARRALAELGVAPVPLLPGERGAPRWPERVVGSMTHCDGYRAAAVARRSPEVLSVGIDAEPHRALPPDVLEAVALPSELRRVEGLARRAPHVHWDRLLFSAKESVYKAWFPLTRTRLGFDEADIALDLSGSFRAVLLRGPGPSEFAGRWLVADGLLATAVTYRA